MQTRSKGLGFVAANRISREKSGISRGKSGISREKSGFAINYPDTSHWKL
jgi:hypothetical protein